MSRQSTPQNERRRHERYQLLTGLAKGPVVTVEVAGVSLKFPVLNWSYGGVQMALPAATAPLRAAEQEGVLHLRLAGELTQAVRFNVVSATSNTMSCSFIHDTPDALLFMRPWIECLRRGAALTELSKTAVKPELSRAGWRVWRGDGPLTLSVQLLTAGGTESPDNWRIVFQAGQEYAEVGATDGKVFTRKSLDNDGFNSPRMQASGEKDVTLLNHAVMLLNGEGPDGVPTLIRASLVDQLRAGS